MIRPTAPILLLREAVAAMLGRSVDDPVVREVAVCYQEAAQACEEVVLWRHGAARLVVSDGRFLKAVVEKNYPTVR